eukprot:CAMPEP_0168237214 /NCGR_PEP_ID=MMETSP0140_2-20121125/20072_1 /TAXON_ID=44445 /ORGANISM="Pseudo-nitzschia australis, Strain 10249 10 AB" /LENGTH=1086 /DNA_ID=CAMNT_0008170843 /DNA_START=142 /DNA_END=3402 /DNA_ORIENTATION=+
MPLLSSLSTTSISTSMPPVNAEADRWTTREAVRKAYNRSIATDNDDDDDGRQQNGTADDTNCDNAVYNDCLENKIEMQKPSFFRRCLSFLALSLEFLFVSLYNCFHTGLHVALAIAFLALVAVSCLRSFHDGYFVTILDRARRTDSDLQNEITYYNRKCGTSDVTTSKYNRIHLGLDPDADGNDAASEIFVDPSRFEDDDNDKDKDTDNDTSIKYQQKRLQRRRRRFAPAYNIWEDPPLKPVPKKVAKRAGQQAVHSMMKHGTVMIPQMLSEATMWSLREFITEKNERVQGTSDQYPMSKHHHRISYGIESTEHPAVVKALKEIHDHRVFAELIQNLVGDENPALSEITAITSWAGAESQGWHPDVKPDGNGVMFGRTYSHSYSLFLPLQDTVGSMGPTDLCPGTHMCADEDLWDMCSANKIGLHEIRKAKPRHEYDPGEKGTLEYMEDVSKEGTWRAGDGALLNQQGWHRGTAHTDEDREDRVVFIVSFLKRPRADDPRQLARGTYFHQKWLNWGSTWEDMADTVYSLKRPWNILRCLHLYKPHDRSWGYDLFTATTLRVANNQMGGQPDDLRGIIDNVMVPLNYPLWLQGTIDYESDDAWQVYLKETIYKTYDFLFYANAFGIIGFALSVCIAAYLAHVYERLGTYKHKQTSNPKPSFAVPVALQTSAWRLVWTHGSIFALGLYVWHVTIRSSQWAIDIDSGTTLMRPFPPDPIYRDEDPGVQGGNTTLPGRSDVLIGTRFHTRAIGAYRKWLDYHPGNCVLNAFVDTYGGKKFYQSLLLQKKENYTTSLLPVSLTDQLALSAFDTIQKQHGGRFVMQDYRSGDWKILSEAESMEYIHSRLFVGGENTLLGSLQEETDLMLNRYRFGVQRKTLSMAWNSQLFAADLSKELFSPANNKDANQKSKETIVRNPSSLPSLPAPFSILPHSDYRFRLPKWKAIRLTVTKSLDENGIRRFLLGDSPQSLYPGMEVHFSPEETFFATVVGLSRKFSRDGRARYQLAFDGEEVSEVGVALLSQVSRESIKPRKPISEGSRVSARIVEDDKDEIYTGTVILVMSDASVDVQFDVDDTIETGIAYADYDVLLD